MSTPETLLELFEPPDEMVGHSAALVAMTAGADFLDSAMERFTRLRPRQRAELGAVVGYLLLDGHASATRTSVLPPGRVPGLHEFQPRSTAPGSLLHAKLALLAFAEGRTGLPRHLRLAVFTANFTYTSARHQLELAWTVDVPMGTSAPAIDRADVSTAAGLVEALLEKRFYREEQGTPLKNRRITARLDMLLSVAAGLAPATGTPRFVHSLKEPLYPQIRKKLRAGVKSPRNLLLCGSAFYEEPSSKVKKPAVLGDLEDLGVFTSNVRRVALVEPSEAGAIAPWATAGALGGWELCRPTDKLGLRRQLHAKFIYAGHIRDGYCSNGWLYLGSGNLTRRGLFTSGAMPNGNIECGVVVSAPERFDSDELLTRFFWDSDAQDIAANEWQVGQVGDGPEDSELLVPSPILWASIEANTQVTGSRCLRLAWRDDVVEPFGVTISWSGAGWLSVEARQRTVPLQESEAPTALHVRDDITQGEWVVAVVEEGGRVGWQPPRFETYEDALAALLDFPIRSADATGEEEDDDTDDATSPTAVSQPGAAGDAPKSYALFAAAQLIESVAALQMALPAPMLEDWIEHLDRTLRGAFPSGLIEAWRAHRINVFVHLREPELRPQEMTDAQRGRYFGVLERAASVWGLE